jgi:hypothetical protein
VSPPRPPDWSAGPALSVIVTRLATLYARALRVDLERRARDAAKFAALLTREEVP